MSAGDVLPVPLEEELSRLSHEGWRERKEAVGRVLRELSRIDPDTLLSLCSRLLDGLVATDAVRGRAACHEVLVSIGSRCLPLVRERIGDRGPATRLLVDLIGEIGGEAEATLLAEIVGNADENPNLRASAATALGRIGGAEAEAGLRRLLGDPSEMLQVYAVDGLRTAGAAVPVSLLEPLVQRPVTRKGATLLLGLTRTADALPVLVPLLTDKMAGVRAAAAVALVQLDAALATEAKGKVVANTMAGISVEARARVRELIHHRDEAVRQAGARAATLAGDVEGLREVLPAMDDPVVHEEAMRMVSELGDAANAALAQVASNVDATHRGHLFRLIGGLKVDVVHPKLSALLLEGLEDTDENARCAAAEALRYVGGRPATGALYRAMGEDGPPGELAAAALAEIALRLRGPRQDDVMLIVSPTWPQQGALARNLCRVVGRLESPDHVPHLVSLLGSIDADVRVAAAQALGRISGEHEGAGALSFALADEEPQVRAAACRSLGTLGLPQSCQSLLSATSDPSPLVRSAAVQALVAIDNPIALPRLREIIADDPVPTVIVHAIAGLGSSGLDQDLTMLMSLCISSEHEVVKAAVRALVNFRAHRATAALLGLLDHARWDVRWAAADALGQRGDATALESVRRACERETDELVKQELLKAADRIEKVAEAGPG
jgi:HEAT repeat protein